MRKSKSFDCVFKYDNDIIFTRKKDVKKYAYVEDGFFRMVGEGEAAYMEFYRNNDDCYFEDDFDVLYRKALSPDSEGAFKCYNVETDEVELFERAELVDYEHAFRIVSEHGLSESKYDFEGYAEVLSGNCFVADNYISQDYPNACHQEFYKFVDENGKEYYFTEITPFFTDEQDYVQEIITKEEFEKYENGVKTE